MRIALCLAALFAALPVFADVEIIAGKGTADPSGAFTISSMSVTGNAVFRSSITGGAFFGDGAGLTGVSGTDATRVLKAGDTMTGELIIQSSGSVDFSWDVGGDLGVHGPATFLSSVTLLNSFSLVGDLSANDFAGSTMSLSGNGATETSLAITEGRVGFGTTAPAEALDVRGDAVFDSSVNASAFFGDGAGLTNVTGTDATRVLKAGDTMTGNLNINGNSLFRASDGALGIGLTSPGENFHQSGGSMLLDGTGATTRDAGWQRGLEIQPGSGEFSSLVFGNQGTGESSALVWTASVSGDTANQIGATIWATPQSATRTDLWFTTNDTIGSAVDDVQMVITGPGNIGMGTTNPLTKLDVVGTIDGDEFTESGGTTLSNSISGNAATATALSANGSNCSAGLGAGGVGTAGNAEDCTDYVDVSGDTMTGDLNFGDNQILNVSSVGVNGTVTAGFFAGDGSGLTNLNGKVKAQKTVSESVANSTTLQNDDELLVPLLANTTYLITGIVFSTSTSATPDIKFGFTIPSGARVKVAYDGVEAPPTGGYVAGVVNAAGDNGDVFEVPSGGTESFVKFFGVVSVGATSGNLQFQWAQNTSNAATVTVLADSWLKAEEL